MTKDKQERGYSPNAKPGGKVNEGYIHKPPSGKQDSSPKPPPEAVGGKPPKENK